MSCYNIDLTTEDYNVNLDSNYEFNISLGEAFLYNQYTAGEGLTLTGNEFSIESGRLTKIDTINLSGAGNLFLSDDGTYKSTPDTGEVNTASNLTGDEGVFAQKNGVDLEFKSLVAGSNISLSSDVNSITINSTGGNPFDQDLNTTDDVTFNSTNTADGYKIGTDLVFNYDSANTNYNFGVGAGGSSTGNNNFNIGTDAGKNCSSTFSFHLGTNAGDNATGNYNFFIGTFSGRFASSGNNNVGIGYQTLRSVQSSANIAIGELAMWKATASTRCVSVGAYAGENLSTGTNNTSIGYRAGNSATTGSSNVFIGYRSGQLETGSNKLYIANNNTTPWFYGDLSGANYRIGINTTTISEVLTINGNIDLTSGNVLKINGTQVLTSQQVAIPDLAGGATLTDVINKVNDILAMLRTHGLIAT